MSLTRIKFPGHCFRNLIDKESFLVFSIALALGVTGVVSILASDDLLACFVAGNVFAWEYVQVGIPH